MEYGLTASTIERTNFHKYPTGIESDYRFVWEVNYATVCRKKFLIIVNSDTRYSMIYANVKPGVWKDMAKFIHQAIEDAFLKEGFHQKQIDKYFKLAGNEILTKTHGKKAIGGLNHITNYVYYLLDECTDEMFQTELTQWFNKELCNTALHPERPYLIPYEYFRMRMNELLSE